MTTSLQSLKEQSPPQPDDNREGMVPPPSVVPSLEAKQTQEKSKKSKKKRRKATARAGMPTVQAVFDEHESGLRGHSAPGGWLLSTGEQRTVDGQKVKAWSCAWERFDIPKDGDLPLKVYRW